jgi:hypothetical protein
MELCLWTFLLSLVVAVLDAPTAVVEVLAVSSTYLTKV